MKKPSSRRNHYRKLVVIYIQLLRKLFPTKNFYIFYLLIIYALEYFFDIIKNISEFFRAKE